MNESKTIKQNERESEYRDLLVIYEHYTYELPSKEGYVLIEDDIEKLIVGFANRYGLNPANVEARLYHEQRTYNEVVESL
ncbi:hypothetical protein [Bacillus cereus]|uniref:hypothetical protein n=1 Tax=Bacillus cereus TaxID=1396 RepID=UPI000BF7352A|nr:hypothetical protein [Bacillus cereus]PFC61601.1 hypothetical protein CN267_11085 [Bacillus cereus]